jgi:hypothetical protein
MRYRSSLLVASVIGVIIAAWVINHPLQASGLIQSAYNLIENGGTAVAREPTVNFINGGCVDNAGSNRTDCTIGGGGGTGGGITVFSGSTITLLGTQYLAIGGGAAVSSTEASVEIESPTAASVSNLSVQLSAALGIGASAVFTWRDGASAQVLTCTVSGATATTCADNTHSFSVAQGDEIDIQVVTTGTPAAVTVVIGTQIGASSAGGGGFIQTFTPPVAANFTQVNYSTGSGVVTTQTNNTTPVTSITVLQHDPNATGQTAALLKNKLAATFTITLAFTQAAAGTGLAGLAIYDGSTNLIFMCQQTASGFRVPEISLAGSFVGDVTPIAVAGPLALLDWVRIQETASARNYYVSSDGINWAQYFSESNTAHFTTTQYGFAVESRTSSTTNPDAMGTLYSFTETNP